MEENMSFPTPYYNWRPHPWHGLEPGPNPPKKVLAYIEITPFTYVKYEVDKKTGYLRVDRPQPSSSLPPSLYGFIPRTYCKDRVAALSPNAKCGDGDPLDICVLTERPINHSEIILDARVIGGLQMIDNGEADDKIIAVLDNDQYLDNIKDISDIPKILQERLRHYFNTYKSLPGENSKVQIDKIYGHKHAYEVVKASIADYDEVYAQ
jgi:inorganic pyrophosphatase